MPGRPCCPVPWCLLLLSLQGTVPVPFMLMFMAVAVVLAVLMVMFVR